MTEAPETDPFTFSSRLFLTYFLAGLAFVAADKSAYVLGLSFVGWVIFTVRLIWRFGKRGALALAGAPLAFYWAFPIWLGPAGARDIVV